MSCTYVCDCVLLFIFVFFFFKQKTAYEIYQCDWSSDVCSSDLEYWNKVYSLAKETLLDQVNTIDETDLDLFTITDEIGRASCRERV